jgi:heme A synthase
MIEIIVVILLCLHIGKIAKRKGLQPGIWRFYTVLAWIVAEMIGIGIAVFVLNSRDLLGLMFMGLICAVGGYLLVKSILDKKPDHVEDDIDRIGTDDLRP